jgi:hypothetical protein
VDHLRHRFFGQFRTGDFRVSQRGPHHPGDHDMFWLLAEIAHFKHHFPTTRHISWYNSSSLALFPILFDSQIIIINQIIIDMFS